MTIGDKVISISKFIDDHIRLFFPDCKNRLVNINRGIDTSYFNIDSVSQTRKENFRKSTMYVCTIRQYFTTYIV